MFDTVASFGNPLNEDDGSYRLYKPGRLPIKTAVHAIARDETRPGFDLTKPEGFSNRPFIGGHANIGGSLKKRGLGDAALRWVAEQANVNAKGHVLFDLSVIGFDPGQPGYSYNVVVDYDQTDRMRKRRIFVPKSPSKARADDVRTGRLIRDIK